MKSFEWVQPETVADAAAALAHPGAMALAGGVDLLDRLKERVESPSRLVSLRKLPLDHIGVGSGEALLGARATLAAIAAHPGLAASHRIFVEAAQHAATPQIRAMATLGGNLAQRTRCWYYRSEAFTCRKKGGTACPAQPGDNQLHAIFNNKLCAATHPSTLATALVALGAVVELTGASTRKVPLADLLIAPEKDVTRELDLRPGELITKVIIPPVGANVKTAYTKQVAKQSFDWPIVDVAVALTMSGNVCKEARIVLGSVAPTPRRSSDAERALIGSVVDVISAGRAAKAAVTGATPLSGNEYKVQILEVVVARTILAAVGRHV
jgi:xanthine dehydrogenase YagS FAD-binding subunit